MTNNSTERQRQAAADQLLIDERNGLIEQAAQIGSKRDARGFLLDWYDETSDTAYRMRGEPMTARAYLSYSLRVQTSEDDPSRLVFDEHAATIQVFFGPLQKAVEDLSYEHTQIYLGTILHRALGNLIAENYDSANQNPTV